MSRIGYVEKTTATAEAKELLETIERQTGGTPNLLKVFANSPSTLAGFLDLSDKLHQGRLGGKTREQIALAVAEANACQYCVSAHTALATKAGLSPEEMDAARRGSAADAKADTAVKFAKAVLDNMGGVTTQELLDVRAAGYGDGEIVEIIAHVGLNVLTNLLAKAAQLDIDFPEVALLGSGCEGVCEIPAA